MKEFALIGHPVKHSKSQDFFNEKFRLEGIDARYINADLETIEEMGAFLKEHPSLCGFNVTSPYKRAILPYLQDLDVEADYVGAVNTVVVEKRLWGRRRLIGFNTDVEGFYQSMLPIMKKHYRKALILGSGGASRAVQRAFKKLGVMSIVVSRKGSLESTIGYEEVTPELLSSCFVVVNATPLGMTPDTLSMPSIPYDALTPDHLCYDLIYSPEETQFLHRARMRGAEVKNGIDMLLIQANENWRIWSRYI